MVGLGHLPGGPLGSHANDVTADGSVVVGSAGGGAGMWTQASGWVDIRSHLIALGATGLTGWHLESAMAISDDGLAIVGYTTNPSGQMEAWLARLTPLYASVCFGAVLGGSGVNA